MSENTADISSEKMEAIRKAHSGLQMMSLEIETQAQIDTIEDLMTETHQDVKKLLDPDQEGGALTEAIMEIQRMLMALNRKVDAISQVVCKDAESPANG